jgi:hypothetical protein
MRSSIGEMTCLVNELQIFLTRPVCTFVHPSCKGGMTCPHSTWLQTMAGQLMCLPAPFLLLAELPAEHRTIANS